MCWAIGSRWFAANTSVSLTDTSGVLIVIDIATRATVREIPLGGQPDSIEISDDGRYAAIVVENERNEDLCVGGTADGTEVDEDECVAGGGILGALPQTLHGNPAGYLAVLQTSGDPVSWPAPAVASLIGLAAYAPEDPEPEFVDINDRNEAVVTLQENNHIVVVDLRTLAVKEHFPAGTVTVHGVDLIEDGTISLDGTLHDVAREPDAVAWIPGPAGRQQIATANEGDLFGGSRGLSIFRRGGQLSFDSGNSLEELAVEHGHYPEGRSDAKGTEPEAIEYARFGHDDYLFVGTERGNFVAVYSLNRAGRPHFEQLLPGPIGPEGLLAIPERNLLVVSGEVDLTGLNARSTVMIYELTRGEPAYPQIMSRSQRGSPIPWSAMSGMTAIPWRTDLLLAVWDSAYTDSKVFRVDVSQRPAVITSAITLQGGGGNCDPEGIAVAPDGSVWIASEGTADDSRPNLLLKTDARGNVLAEIGLPDDILTCRAVTTRRGTLGSGFEGVAVLPSFAFHGRYRLVVAQQRGWDYTTPGCEDLDDDAGGFNASNEPNRTRLWIYDPWTRRWSHVAWELAPKPANAAWVGLSEITEVPGTGEYIVIERDNRTGPFGALKTLTKFDWSGAADQLVSQSERQVFDLLPKLTSTRGWITDKPEGTAVTWTGDLYVITDNDGVDDWSGETWFFDLGRYSRLFH
jgi:DNA-binding beta-propeller fold protein YncE